MQITWLGQACFKIQTNNTTIIIDPFDPKIGLKMPRVTADIVLSTHDHYDHNNISAIKGTDVDPFIINNPGEYEVKDVFIYGIKSFHDKSEGKERGDNTIYRIEAENINLAHLGDLGHALSNGQLEQLQGVDILMIPVGGTYTINAKEANEVISQIEPRIVIPMHYKIKGLNINLDPIDKFCKETGVCATDTLPKLKIVKKDLPQEEMKIIILQPA
ncbi:lactamase [Candidatus Parcubacteria bacterium]|nr:MAG: lactamase [Candidatus Parcubacteria bacterium]